MDQHLDWIYCIARPEFFDAPDRIDDGASRFEVADRALPEGWLRAEANLWVDHEPPGARLPAQGWKIHVSVTLPDAPRCLDIVWDYCVRHQLSFKFLRSLDAMLVCNGKYAGRGSSGKLVTIYPPDEARFAQALTDLSALLADMPGPYILGDLRIGAGPLYVRYGAFAEMWCAGPGDEPVLAIEDGHGNLVPDRRGPVFVVPDWVPVPDVLRQHLQARHASGTTDFPYRVEQALHFSNGGGVYLARDASGGQVVLREARPHAGLDRHRTDAVTRLGRERAALTRLAGLDCVPRLLDYRVVQDHHFLVEEYVAGTTLLRAIQTRNPTKYPDTPPTEVAAQVAAYRDWAVATVGKVAEALAAIHARGVRFGDLHPANILLRPDGRVVLIDFEFAADLTDPTPPGLGAPGFIAPDPHSGGAAVDEYALACLQVYPFMMLTPLIDLDRGKAPTIVRAAEQFAGMPAGFGASLIRAHGLPADGTCRDEAAEMFAGAEPCWPRIRDSLVAGIHANATPYRSDRLFPGSPGQFRTDGYDLAHGAAGVLLALHRVGAPIPEEYLDWLIGVTRHARVRPCQGLYNGPHGVAAVLDTLGRRDAALEMLRLARRGDALPASDTLYGGEAGRALNLLHFARVTGDDALLAAAVRIGAGVAARLTADRAWTGGHGLLRGPSGPALLFLDLYEELGAEYHLDLARRALGQDLDLCLALDDETVQLHVGSRYLAYLDGGGGGVGLVIDRYLRHRPDPRLARFLAGIRRSCTMPFVYQPGLFTGRAGFLGVLAQLDRVGNGPVLLDHVRRFGWHALLWDGNLVFPGEQLLRLSMDLATGSAGILLAMQTAFEDGAELLPYLTPQASVTLTSP